MTFLGILGVFARPEVQSPDSLPPEARKTHENAIWLAEQGLPDAALDDLEKLHRDYPLNYLVGYNRALTLYEKGDLRSAEKAASELIRHNERTCEAYHLYGNILDDIGKKKKAENIYKKGVKLFPESGQCQLELGVICIKDGKILKALEWFNKGISADPLYAPNYYRGARIYSVSTSKIWSLVYAEAAFLLDPMNEDRHAEMGKMIAGTFRECVRNSHESASGMPDISFVPERGMTVDEKTGNVFLDFEGIYEGCIANAFARDTTGLVPFTGSIRQLTLLRKRAVEEYFRVTDNLYGNSMYLLPFQKSIIDAGYWEEYNYILFMHLDEAEFSEWIKDNMDRLEAFQEWYNESPFCLDRTHTVGVEEVYSDYRKISLLDAMNIQAALLTEPSSGKGI